MVVRNMSKEIKKDMKEKNKGGRPTMYTPELASEICADLAQGMSLRTVCKSDERPSLQTIFNWFRKVPGFVEQYEKAKQESADAMSEEILDIADDGSNDWMEREHGGSISWVTNGESMQRSRLRVDTRKWLMSKMKPKKYGEKLDVTSDGKALPTPLLASMVLEVEKKEELDDDIE